LNRDAEDLWKSKNEIKQLLHPKIPSSMLPNESELKQQPHAKVNLSLIKD